MISYFKYTDGSDFTLNGSSYSGLINVIDSTVYTGSVFNSNSRELSSTNTFLAKCFEENLNFNFSSSTSLKDQIQQVSIYPRTILTLDTLKETLNVLSKNNAIIFAAGVRFDNKFLNPLYRSLSAQAYVNAVTSLKESILKPVKLPLYKYPVIYAEQRRIVGFNDVFTGTPKKSSLLLIDQLSGFKYFNSRARSVGGVAEGLVNSEKPLTFGAGFDITLDFTHTYLHYNRYTNLLYQTNAADFCVYDVSYSSPTPRVFLQDIIKTSNFDSNITGFKVSYGRHFRCGVSDRDNTLEIYNISDSKMVSRIQFQKLNFTSVAHICQRFEDDLLILVVEKGAGRNIFASYDI